MTREISTEEKTILLKAARQAIESNLKGEASLTFNDSADITPALREPGACFVTLSIGGKLRGCVGSIEAKHALIQDVSERAVSAAFQDPRFPALTADEFTDMVIEISVLTEPESLIYETPEDLIGKLRVGIDGVILNEGFRRATFLPQVWDKIPDPEIFLSRLCQKMGLPPDAWREKKLDVKVYQVEKFTEMDP